MGISMPDVDALEYTDYLGYRRDAFIWKMNGTEHGREYLDNAYRLEQKKPDREGLRKRFGGKNGE